MADFKTAYARTMINEGGYANDPDDRGGETIFGISRRANPRWVGWKIVDQLKINSGGSKTSIERHTKQNNQLHKMAEDLYRRKYWRATMDKMASQRLADMVFDMSVNAGLHTSIVLLQEAINKTLYVGKLTVAVDGIIGPRTVGAINNICMKGEVLQLKLRYANNRVAHYFNIALNRPSNIKFLKGWVKRAMQNFGG